jgi:hypothetical protein
VSPIAVACHWLLLLLSVQDMHNGSSQAATDDLAPSRRAQPSPRSGSLAATNPSLVAY